ncbi:MAG: transcription elongation factor GreA [bacterium]
MPYITKDGLAKLEKEREELEKVKRPDVIERIRRAKELGDLSENAEYQEAREEQSFIEGRIIELSQLINHAVLIDENGDGASKKIVNVGSTVIIKEGNTEKEFTIVGPSEAKPQDGFISNESPLGQAFIGHKKGDEVEIKVPKGKVKYKIVKIK